MNNLSTQIDSNLKDSTNDTKNELKKSECSDIIILKENKEIWKEIPKTNGQYFASNLGKIKSVYRNIVNQIGFQKIQRREYIFKPTIKKGYSLVSLRINNKYLCCGVHRLIAMAFLPSLNNFIEINHINGNKQDNRPENLEWTDRKGNMRHAWKHNLMENARLTGEKHHKCKITEEIVLKIRNEIKVFKNVNLKTKIAKQYNISVGTINDILKRRSWTHI